MRAPAPRLLLLAVGLALLAAPGGAAAASPEQLSAPAQMRAMVRERAAQGSGDSQPAVRPVFRLKTGSGYEVQVAGVRGNVVIYVLRGSQAKSVTAYVARGTVTAGRIAAGFGKFGKVSMRFRPAKQRTSAKHRTCRGAGRFESRPGAFVGEFKFRGEGGYISVQARRANGQVDSVAPQCRSGRSAQRVELATHPSQNGFWGPELPYLVSDWRRGVAAAHFAAVGGGKQGTIFIARTEQAHGKFAIFRLALMGASSPKALKVSNALTSARVSPPAPFSGTGNYRAAPDGTVSWSGPLAVDFPGAPHYPLTGPPFEASIGTTSEPFFAFF